MRRCPHCGNSSPATIETNGCRSSHPDLTLLCVARVAEEDSADDTFQPQDYDGDGLVICGAVWTPNQPW